jgi:hypothetical protein
MENSENAALETDDKEMIKNENINTDVCDSEFVGVNSKDYAYVTLIFKGDNYVSVALTLAQSLHDHGTKASLVVLVTHDVSTRARIALSRVFDEVIEVPYFTRNTQSLILNRFYDTDQSNFMDHVLTKYHCLSLTQYKKVCLLDADLIALDNPDSIFRFKTPAGYFWILPTENTHQKLSEEMILKLPRPSYANGGIHVLSPSLQDHADIFKFVDECGAGHPSSTVGPDQYVIMNFYRKQGWYHFGGRYALSKWCPCRWKDNPYFMHLMSDKPLKTSKYRSDFKLYEKYGAKLILLYGDIMADIFPSQISKGIVITSAKRKAEEVTHISVEKLEDSLKVEENVIQDENEIWRKVYTAKLRITAYKSELPFYNKYLQDDIVVRQD